MQWKDAFGPGQVYTVPNGLSVLRVLLLPFFVYYALLYEARPDGTGLAVLLGLVLVAAIADFLDGFLARRWNQATILGQYLDPVADKTVAVVSLAMVTYSFGFPLWAFLLYIGRELFGVWGGTFLYFRRDIQGEPNWFGKIGVSVITVTVIWYLCVPYLATRLPAESVWLRPELAAYVLIAVLAGGVIQYIVTYHKIIFTPDSRS